MDFIWKLFQKDNQNHIIWYTTLIWVSLVVQLVKNPPIMMETWVGSLVWSPGEGNTYPLQSPNLENSMDYIVQGVLLPFSCSVMSDSLPPMKCSAPVISVLHHLPEFSQTHVHWVGDAIQPSHPLSSPSLPAFNHCQHWVFSNESALLIRCPKYWGFSFRISPSNEYSKLISFRIDWFDLLVVQGTLKNLLQHHNSKTNSLVLCLSYGPTLTSVHD